MTWMCCTIPQNWLWPFGNGDIFCSMRSCVAKIYSTNVLVYIWTADASVRFPLFSLCFGLGWPGLAWPGLEMKFVAHNLPNCITSNCGAFFLTLPLHHTYMHKVQCKLYIDNVPCTCMHSTLAEHLIYDSVVPLFVLLVFSLCWFYVCKLTWLRNVSFLFLVGVRLVYSIYNVIAKIYNSNYWHYMVMHTTRNDKERESDSNYVRLLDEC